MTRAITSKLPKLLIALLLLFISDTSSAWGLFDYWRTDWGRTFLTKPILENKQINYCLNIADTKRFTRQSIRLQLESALRVWLFGARDFGIADTNLREVDCQHKDLNLMVTIAQQTEPELQSLGAYQIAQYQSGRFFSLIFIDTAYAWKSYSIVDLASLLPNRNDLATVIEQLSFQANMSLKSASQLLGIDENALYWSTYRIFLHELGHSFGLCDTYDSQVQRCDSMHSSKSHPSSLMKDSRYFYLTEDDLAGLNRIFELFSRAPLSK